MWAALMSLILLVMTVCSQAAGVQTQNVLFGPDDKYCGFMARPSGNGPFPGIVVIHEWWGLNNYIRGEATKLAEEGYVALAVDLFGKSTTDMNEAMAMVRALNQQAATAQMLSAADYLRSRTYVRSDRVGSIGWCFGGGQSLNLAINDPRLAAAVIYYGQPVTDPNQLSKIRARILGIYGEADQSIPMTKVEEFRRALTQAGVRYEIYTYPGAPHAFANPTRGTSYKPEAAKDAWKKTLVFLDKHLKH